MFSKWKFLGIGVFTLLTAVILFAATGCKMPPTNPYLYDSTGHTGNDGITGTGSGNGSGGGGTVSGGIEQVTIIFDGQGGTPAQTSKTIPKGTAAGALPGAVWAGHDFEGWETLPGGGGSDFTATTIVNADITVYAYWTTTGVPHAIITFDAGAGAIPPTTTTKTVDQGDPAGPLKDAERPGYIFQGWYLGPAPGAAPFNQATIVAGDMTVYAHWMLAGGTDDPSIPPGIVWSQEPPYRVMFINSDGSEYDSVYVTYGGNILTNGEDIAGVLKPMPTNPGHLTYTGYSWMNWRDGDGVTFTSGTTVTGNMVIFVNWRDGESAAKAFLVSNEAELRLVGRHVEGPPLSPGMTGWRLSKYYQQTANITMSAAMRPIGNDTATITPFTGQYDGDDFAINNLTVTDPGNNNGTGLFGAISNDGTNPGLVQNVLLNNCTINANRQHIGGIAGQLLTSGIISNCQVININITPSTSTANTRVGGVTGYVDTASGRVEYCFSTGNVIGRGTVGGIVGRNNGTVANCYSSAAVLANTLQSVGGISGTVRDGGSIQNCYSTGSITGSGSTDGTDGIGGVVGLIGEGSIVTNCYSTGNVQDLGGKPVGGVSGGNNNNSGRLLNSVALNSGVQAVISNVGRVLGRTSGGASVLSNNKARTDLVPTPTSLWSGFGVTEGTTPRTGSGLDGEGVDPTTSSVPLSTVFAGWSAAVWDIPAGNLAIGGALPRLIGMPGGVYAYPVLP